MLKDTSFLGNTFFCTKSASRLWAWFLMLASRLMFAGTSSAKRPRTPEQEQAAKDATLYVNQVVFGRRMFSLVHDVLVVLTFYAVARWSVGSTFIACMLTIVGYSINATIVIFDRIRERLRTMTGRQDLAELAADNQAFLLANHGPVVCGESLQEAANNMEELEETAKLIFILGDRPIRYLTAGEIAELRS